MEDHINAPFQVSLTYTVRFFGFRPKKRKWRRERGRKRKNNAIAQ